MARSAQDIEFASEYDSALRQGVPRAAAFSVLVVAGFVGLMIAWAHWAMLDEVTRGQGRVIPSSKTQLVQSLEGGIVKELLVRPGDHVAKGDILARIDDTSFSSNLGELNAKRMALQAAVARLRHEASGDLAALPSFPDEIAKAAPDLIDNETALYVSRRDSLETVIGVQKSRVEQRERELNETKASLASAEETLRLAGEEMKIKEPLGKRGIVPRTEILKLEREIADAKGQIAVLNQTIPKMEASIREAQGEMEIQREKFRQDARTDISQHEADLAIVMESLRAADDRVVRADIRSPVDGIVNKINSNTVGGVVQAGETMMEVVPLEDSLFVEAKIRPSDIAFIHPKQPAVVKITAYDFSIYGGLEGEVERISADSVYDEEARENFYLVTVKTLRSQLKNGKEELPIIPGMVASVDILTGKKSVLDYLLKPINKAREEALRER
jgi:membrane fusion protein, adhesin transport system